MSMTCLMVLLVVLGTCLLRKYVFDTYGEVRCRNYHRGLSQRWKNTATKPFNGELAFSFPCQFQGVKSKNLCHFLTFNDLLIAKVTNGGPIPGNYKMHDVVTRKGAFGRYPWANAW